MPIKPQPYLTQKETSQLRRLYNITSAAYDRLHDAFCREMDKKRNELAANRAYHLRDKAARLATRLHRRWEKAMNQLLKCQGHPSFITRRQRQKQLEQQRQARLEKLSKT